MLRPVTERVFKAMMMDVWPDSPAALVDFGLDTDAHYAALSRRVRSGAITAEQLDAACGNGPALTKLVDGEVTFTTSHDDFEIGEEDDDEDADDGDEDPEDRIEPPGPNARWPWH